MDNLANQFAAQAAMRLREAANSLDYLVDNGGEEKFVLRSAHKQIHRAQTYLWCAETTATVKGE